MNKVLIAAWNTFIMDLDVYFGKITVGGSGAAGIPFYLKIIIIQVQGPNIVAISGMI